MSNGFEEMSEFLKNHSIMTIATIGPDGRPALDTVDYLWDGESVLFFTDLRSRKAANFRVEPQVTAIVADQDAEFLSARSVEVYGTVEQSADPEVIGGYMQNFMARRKEFAAMPPNPSMQENMAVFVIKPTVLRMLDNTKGPGTIDIVEAG